MKSHHVSRLAVCCVLTGVWVGACKTNPPATKQRSSSLLEIFIFIDIIPDWLSVDSPLFAWIVERFMQGRSMAGPGGCRDFAGTRWEGACYLLAICSLGGSLNRSTARGAGGKAGQQLV